MEYKQTAPSDLSPVDAQKVLDFFNAAYTVEDIIETMNEADDKSDGVKLAEAIMCRRTELNTFANVQQLSDIQGVSSLIFSKIVASLTKPLFTFDSEKLQYVMWTHGTSLQVENPEQFGSILRMGRGTRIVNKDFVREEPGTGYSQSWVHFAIPTPAFSSGGRLSIRSVILNFRTSEPPYGIKGTPFVSIEEVHVWDGHIRIASHQVNPSLATERRFERFSVPTGHNVQWGVGVSVNLLMMNSIPGSSRRWIEFGSAGAEFVSRSGLVASVDT